MTIPLPTKKQLIEKTIFYIKQQDTLNVISSFGQYGDIWHTCTPLEIAEVNRHFKYLVQMDPFAHYYFVDGYLYQQNNLLAVIYKLPLMYLIKPENVIRFFTDIKMRSHTKENFPDVIDGAIKIDMFLGAFTCKTIFGRPRVFPDLAYRQTKYVFIVSKKNLSFYRKHKYTAYVTTYDHIRASGMFTVPNIAQSIPHYS